MWNLKFTKKISSFTYLNITQFLGALNDNIYKLLIIFFLLDIYGIENSSRILALAGATFVAPFLLFSSVSGTLADRLSKRNIIVVSKFLEIIAMGLGMLAFSWQTPIGAYCTLFLMATQSAIFGPSKYGIVPELVATEKISKANGILTSLTYLAIILGTFLASFLTEVSYRDFVLASIACISIAIVGFTTSLQIEYTEPAGSQKKFSPLFLREVYRNLKRSFHVPHLLPAILGSSFFLFFGAYIQLNLIPFAVKVLGLTDTQGGYLFLLAAIGIGTGCQIAGRLSGKHVELGLIPLGGLGMAIGCFLLDAYSESLYVILTTILLTGITTGVYLIPLDSYIQFASPSKSRGQFVATANFMSFIGVLLASCMLYIVSDILALEPDKGFTFMGWFTLIVTLSLTWSIRHVFIRFLGLILSRIFFKIEIDGLELVPRETPSVLICNHTSLLDPILLMGSQRRSIRIITSYSQDLSNSFEYLYKVLRAVPIDDDEPFYEDPELLKEIKHTLKKGTTVCVFIDHLPEGKQRVRAIQTFRKLLEGTDYPLIYTLIEKGKKKSKSRPWSRFFEKCRIPALVTYQRPPEETTT